jgi:DHA2 family multidrug resistance protein-like MFS transporter
VTIATNAQDGQRAGSREWAGLALLMIPSTLTMVDISVLFLAMPRLASALGASTTQQLWISDIYEFVIAGFLVTMGRLGDRFGRRRVLLSGVAGFGTLSVLAAYSNSPEMLIICRALLGVTGATIVPSTLVIIKGMFRDLKQLSAAIALWATSLTVGVAIGPIVGGVLLHYFWWGSVFLVAAPGMLGVAVAGRVLLPESNAANSGRLDLVSSLLSLAAILSFIYGFKQIASAGWHLVPALSVLIGLAFGGVFVARQRRLVSPMLDLRLFSIPAIRGSLLLAIIVAAIQGGSGFFVTQYLQLVKGLSPLSAGLWMMIPTVALVLGIFIGMGLAQQVRPAVILSGAAVIAAVGELVLTQLSTSTSLTMLIVAFALVYLGVGPVGPMVGQMVVTGAPPDKEGSASSLQSTAGDLGLALGIALLGSIGAAVYRGGIKVPGVIANTPSGLDARQTIGEAVNVAQHQPPAIAAALLRSAQSAFTSGVATAAVACVVGFVVVGLTAIVTLRTIKPFGAPSDRLDQVSEAISAEVAPSPAIDTDR